MKDWPFDSSVAEAFEKYRGSLTGLAYRMLGSLSDAEDAVQESFVRWQEHPNRGEIENPKAYLSQVAVRICLDRLKSARAKRETYVGEWLPEPVLDSNKLRPHTETLSELASDLSVALLLTLERLSPLERAAFILHDIFETEWPEVASTLARSEEACRQLASRARTRIREEKPRFQPTPEQSERVLMAFGAAVSSGDVSGLSQLLSEDVVFISDGGGEVRSALKPIHGRDHVSRFFIGVQSKARAENDDYSATFATVNDLPGLVIKSHSGTSTLAIDLDATLSIRAIYVVSNPHKLKHIS